MGCISSAAKIIPETIAVLVCRGSNRAEPAATRLHALRSVLSTGALVVFLVLLA
jgi:hypothetical protein